MNETRKDRIEISTGLIHLPEHFRQIARLANRAGLDGFEFVDAEYGIDLDEALDFISRKGSEPADDSITLRVLITYRKLESVSDTPESVAAKVKAAMSLGERFEAIGISIEP